MDVIWKIKTKVHLKRKVTMNDELEVDCLQNFLLPQSLWKEIPFYYLKFINYVVLYCE